MSTSSNNEEDSNTAPISWPTFCSYWKTNYPKLIIQRASEDICDDCVIFANQHKYICQRTGRNSSNQEDGDESDSSERSTDDGVLPTDDARAMDEQLRDKEEDLVLSAAKHVKMA
jgi:hypothetical protein